MKPVKVDINGTRGLALRDAKGSRVTVARVRLGGRCWLRYTGVHGREATVYRRQGRWEVSTWDGLRTTQQPHFPLLRSALAVARQHVGCTTAGPGRGDLLCFGFISKLRRRRSRQR